MAKNVGSGWAGRLIPETRTTPLTSQPDTQGTACGSLLLLGRVGKTQANNIANKIGLSPAISPTRSVYRQQYRQQDRFIANNIAKHIRQLIRLTASSIANKIGYPPAPSPTHRLTATVSPTHPPTTPLSRQHIRQHMNHTHHRRDGCFCYSQASGGGRGCGGSIAHGLARLRPARSGSVAGAVPGVHRHRALG